MPPEHLGLVVRGVCHVYFSLDIGFSVDLKRCASLIHEAREASGFQHHTRAPAYLNLLPAPIHITQTIEPIRGSNFETSDKATITIYDFGAVSVEYRLPFEGSLEQLGLLSGLLYDNRTFAVDARARAESVLEAIRPAVRRPMVRPEAEDYVIFAVPSLGPASTLGPSNEALALSNSGESGVNLKQIVRDNRHAIAQMLSSGIKRLSGQQRREELSRRISYYDDDLTIITWNAALVVGENMDDVLTVLELANVQLRELHYLDDQLDDSLQESYDIQEQSHDVKASMRRIRELMLDGQAFSEAVTNAFKPFPDAFLARVYALASDALGLSHFDRSVKEKLNLLNTFYTTLSDEADHERSMRMELIVIVLIVIEIIIGFAEKLPLLFHK